MKIKKISLQETNKFSETFLAYIAEDPSLKNFYNNRPTLEAFEQQMKEKSFDHSKRTILVEVLKRQYEGISITPAVASNFDSLLKDQTFTVTTGHQLNIFTGPLYFVYKIITAINTAKKLNEKYPNQHFIPVYWMASEDHDLDEIDHFNLFGQKYQWETDQKGAVGPMDVQGLAALAETVKDCLPVFKEAYKQKDLASAVRYYVNALFGETGLVVIDANNSQLKKQADFLFAADLFENKHEALVQEQSQLIESAGHKTQVFPRPINLFYLKGDIRERIEKEGDIYKVLNTDICFSESEMKAEFKNHAERFSPNVILRPVYEEIILPNLSYIGGPSELVYWFQLKPIFEAHQVAFPILQPRNFAMVIPPHVQKKLDKWGIHNELFFSDFGQIKKHIIDGQGAERIDFSKQLAELKEIFDSIKKQTEKIDQTLVNWVGAEESKAEKSLGNIEKRLTKVEEAKHEQAVNQFKKIYDKHFPGGGLQERSSNMMEFAINHESFLQDCLAHFDPFDYSMNIVRF